MTVETYVVSVYRRSSEPGKEAAGLVERAGSGERKAFASTEELWTFLCDKSGIAVAREARVGRVEEARHFDGKARFDKKDLRKLSTS